MQYHFRPSYCCEVHFNNEDYVPGEVKKRLNKNAFPKKR